MNSINISKDEQTKGFENLKSDYFIIKLFNIKKEKKTLKIVKYNKKLQKRLNKSINNYKEYSHLYSSIEIELNLIENKFGQFINMQDKEKAYFHIYFNNTNEEIKRDNLKENEKVKKIKIKIDYQVRSFAVLFKDCYCINSIFFKNFIEIILLI